MVFFFFQAEDGIRDLTVTGVQTCALPILPSAPAAPTRLPQRLRLRDACAGTRQSSCGLALAVPATTSTRCFVGTPTPAAARNGSAANSRTDRVSADRADHSQAAQSQPPRRAQIPNPPCPTDRQMHR